MLLPGAYLLLTGLISGVEEAVQNYFWLFGQECMLACMQYVTLF